MMYFKDLKGDFRLVSGYAYAISRDGTIVGLRTGRVKSVQLNRRVGYNQVTMMADGRYRRMYVHRLVAETFIPNPDGKPYVLHLDGNRLNNNADNLMWATVQEWGDAKRKRQE